MKREALILSVLIGFALSPLFAQGDVLSDLRDVGPYEVKGDGFVLDAGQQITIHAVAASDRYRGIGASAWILEKTSRTAVWKLRNARVHNRSHGLADYDDVIQLPKGDTRFILQRIRSRRMGLKALVISWIFCQRDFLTGGGEAATTRI